MQRDLVAFLWDIDMAAQDIASYIHGREYSDYLNDSMLRAAVERKFITIGEAFAYALRIYPNLPNEIPRVRDVIAFRSRVAHEYMLMDNATVWVIATRDLPVLHEEVVALLGKLDSPPSEPTPPTQP